MLLCFYFWSFFQIQLLLVEWWDKPGHINFKNNHNYTFFSFFLSCLSASGLWEQQFMLINATHQINKTQIFVKRNCRNFSSFQPGIISSKVSRLLCVCTHWNNQVAFFCWFDYKQNYKMEMRRSEEPVGGGSARWLNDPHGCCYISHYVTNPLTRSRYGKTKSTIMLNMSRYPVGILLTTRMLLKAAHIRASTLLASAPKHPFVVGLDGGRTQTPANSRNPQISL